MFNPTDVRMQCQLVTLAELSEFVYYNNVTIEGLRPYNWSVQSQSKYIESILLRIPMTPIYLSENTHEEEDGYTYSSSHVIDGVHRVRSIMRYKSNRFRLTGLEYEFSDDDHTIIELEGKKFSELPEPIQERIDETHLTIHIIESTTPVEIAENLANRLNMRHLQTTEQ